MDPDEGTRRRWIIIVVVAAVVILAGVCFVPQLLHG
jgi:hypothetical protein